MFCSGQESFANAQDDNDWAVTTMMNEQLHQLSLSHVGPKGLILNSLFFNLTTMLLSGFFIFLILLKLKQQCKSSVAEDNE